MSTAIQGEDTVRGLLREAARWRVAGLLFRRPNEARCRELAALSRETGEGDLVEAAGDAEGTSEGLYHAWLGPGGPLSPREVSYRPIEDPGRLLAEIGAFHQAFAYHAGTEDPHDHVAVAADFTAYLALKEAFAAGSAREQDAAVTREARERFVERHVRPVARGMARRLAKVEEDVNTAHFSAAVRLLARLAGAAGMAGDAAASDPPFPPPGLDDAEFDCGVCDHAGDEGCAGPRSHP
jgi:TorA maturation chaperone TorD